MNKLGGKTVLITGASAGIGQALAHRFSGEGCRLVLAARRIDKLTTLAEKLEAKCHLIKLDVRDRAAVESAFEAIPAGFNEIDILLNNAGLSRGLDKLHDGNPDGWDEMIDTNIKGLLYVSRTIIPKMVKRGRGHIINIGSIAGHEVYPNGNVYCATKHAVDALTKGMRLDLFGTPVKVSTIDPGLVETEFSQVRFYGDKERAEKVYQSYQPLKGEDIAESAVWIASQPEHVQIAQVLILPAAQACSTMVFKE